MFAAPDVWQIERPSYGTLPVQDTVIIVHDITAHRQQRKIKNIKSTPVCKDRDIYIAFQNRGIANQWLASVDRVETGNNDDKLTREEIQGFVGERRIPKAFYEQVPGTMPGIRQ